MFYENRLVLVTGGTGFVGSHFVEELLRQGARIRVPIHERPLRINSDDVETVQADLTRQEDCLRVCTDVDYIIHAAGGVGAAGIAQSHMMAGIANYLALTARVLEAAWARGVDRVLVFSSSTTYPAADRPLKEEEMWSGPPHPCYFGYGWMRRYVERLSEFVASESSLGIALCRPTAVYGRHDNVDPKTAHYIPALVRRAIEKEDPFIVWGTGEEIRDVLHITDLVHGCLSLLENHAVCDPVNIGYGSGVAVRDVVRTILEAAGHSSAKVVYDPEKPSTIPVRLVDTSKARRLLHFNPQVTLENGIADTVRWFGEMLGRETPRYASLSENP